MTGEVTAVLALLGAALLLGLRHGCEWHHLVAITDITGTAVGAAGRGRRAGGLAVDAGAVGLAALYAVGHGLVVVVIGLLALFSAALLPEWVTPLTERAVGATLVLMGAWMLWSLLRYWRGETALPVRNRLALLSDAAGGLRRLWSAWQQRHCGLPGERCESGYHVHPVGQYRRYGARAAFAVGVVHGIGAETATQVLLIAAVSGSTDGALGAGLLLAFVAGMLLSNTALAFATSLGFLSSRHARTVYVALAALTAVASLYVGACALLGVPHGLPELFA